MTEGVQRRIGLESVREVGIGLRRPECVQIAANGDVLASHMSAGLVRISAGGAQQTIGAHATVEGQPWVPNGFAALPDGDFLVANMGEGGGVWRLSADGSLASELREVDGETLAATNFVLRDHLGRLWITVSTRHWPISGAFVHEGGAPVADGYVVLVDERGARIVADGLAFANELRLDASGQRLLVAETMAGRITCYDIGIDGSLRNRRVLCQLDRAFPDGIAFDEQGHLWTTSIISNQVIRIGPDGSAFVVLEEPHPDHVANVVSKMADGTITREDMQNAPTRLLRNISSIAFGGRDGRTVYLGSLGGSTLVSFRSDVAGLR